MSVKWWLLCQAVTIDATNNTLKFKEAGGATLTATLTPGTYYLSGTEGADDLGTAVEDAITAAAAATCILTYRGKIETGSPTAFLNFYLGGSTLQLIDSGSTFDFTSIGFPQSDSSADANLASTLSSTVTWCGDQPAVERDPSEDKSYVYESRTPSGKADVNQYGDDQEIRRLVFEFIEGPRVVSTLATDESDPARAFQAWRRLAKLGAPFQLYLIDESAVAGVLNFATTGDLVGTYTLTGEILNRLVLQRTPNASNARDFSFVAHPYIA